MKIEKGKRYSVICDDRSVFKGGEVVVPLEDSDDCVWCVRAIDYDEQKTNVNDYEDTIYGVMKCIDLDVIKGEDYAFRRAFEEAKKNRITIPQCRELREIAYEFTKGCLLTEEEYIAIMQVFARAVNRLEMEDAGNE